MMLTSFFILSALVTVTHCRVTFTHSEVLQQTDLDPTTKTAKFKCDNGCYVYSDSQNADMWINDGTRDMSNFMLMGPPDKEAGPTYLVKWNDYRLEYRGKGNPPVFVFYAVDQTAPNLETVVVAKHAALYEVDSKSARRFTVLNSYDPTPAFAITGDYMAGFPRIYATGFDAIDEDCRPVYQGRSSESVANSWLSIPSPIITIDKGPSVAKSAATLKTSGAFENKVPNSSLIYMSPGYVGCSYIKNQIYSSNINTVLDTFSAEVKNLDISAGLSIPTENEAVAVTVNNVKTNFFGSDPQVHHYEDDRFDITISWIRINPTTSFAMQFDLGVTKDEVKTSTVKTSTAKTTTTTAKKIDEKTAATKGNDAVQSTTDRTEKTTTVASGTFTLLSMLIVAHVAIL